MNLRETRIEISRAANKAVVTINTVTIIVMTAERTTVTMVATITTATRIMTATKVSSIMTLLALRAQTYITYTSFHKM